MLAKPADVVGRTSEWAALAEFTEALTPAGGVGLLYGRRRTGKSFLLRRLSLASGGLYFQATESERSDALREFSGVVAESKRGSGFGDEPISYNSWDDALSKRAGLVVIDEFPYLLRHSPELPSLLQRLIDEANNGAREPLRIIVCGSSMSVMTQLLSGQQPLRGRATLDIYLKPMDHVEAARLWGLDDLEVAIRLHAIFGGAPGYRALTSGAPGSVDDLGRWLQTNVLSPNHALYREDDYLLSEERTITDRSLYSSLLRSIASGVATQTELAGRLGRSRESLTHPLNTLIDAGFVLKENDLIASGRPRMRLSDPIVRFLRLVVDPNRGLLEDGRWEEVWQRARHRLDANIYGPHLEAVARRWATRTFSPKHDTSLVTACGYSRVSDQTSRSAIELDVVATGDGPGVGTGAGREVILLAEVKWSPDGFGGAAIERLQQARSLMAKAGHDVSHCELALISRQRSNLPGEGLRIGLDDLYGNLSQDDN